MCGRVVVASPRDFLVDYFEVNETVGEELPARYNVAPSLPLYAVAGTATGRRLGILEWGLVPSWATDPSAGPRPINARAETLLDRAHFAEALERRRCLVPADGFYEWDEARRPHFISRADGQPLALAALWDRWTATDGEALATCAIVTTEANAPMRSLHDRMPAILPRDAWDAWLDPTVGSGPAVHGLLQPAADDVVVLRRASRRVNSTANDDAALLDPDDDPVLELPFGD